MRVENQDRKDIIMSIYDHRIVAQIYDKINNDKSDIQLLKDLIGNHRWKILEPMCGTARILSELRVMDHDVVGIERSTEMTNEARKKMADYPDGWSIMDGSVDSVEWGDSYDLIVLGSNALLELATPKDQEALIGKVGSTLPTGGRLFLDCSVLTGKRRYIPRLQLGFEGENDYGTHVVCSVTHQSSDRWNRLKVTKRLLTRTQDGNESEFMHTTISHVPTARQIRQWCIDNNMNIVHQYRDCEGRPASDSDERLILWAVKHEPPESEE